MLTAMLLLLLAAILAFAVRAGLARRRAEKALKESRQRFERAFTHAPIGMALVAPDGSCLDANLALCELVGYDRDELLLRDFQSITHPDDLEADLHHVRMLLAGEVPAYQLEKRYLRKSGETVWILLSASLVRDLLHGSPLYFVAQIQDITDRKEAERHIRHLNLTLEERVVLRTEQLAERERQLETLVGKLLAAQEEERRRVAYEVHDGPTQLLIATHQLLQAFAEDHPPGATVAPGALDRPLQLAQRAVKEARHIIENLRPTALDDFGLAAALRFLVEELRDEGWDATYDEGDLGDQRLAPELETALYRVAQEAINNVRKHAATNRAALSLSRVANRASEAGQPNGKTPRVRLEVRDWGRGFDAADDPRRGPGAAGPGTRVGLSGMRERLALLDGTLLVESKPGKGTSLIAELPLPPEAPTDDEAMRKVHTS